MNTYSLYVADTGLFTGVSIFCPHMDLARNIPEGQSCVLGEYARLSQRVDLATGLVIDYIPPQPSVNHAWNSETKRWLYVKTDDDIAAEVRTLRAGLMSACDWTQLPDVPPATRDLWATYRQALRDISKQSSFPRSVIWPTIPERK